MHDRDWEELGRQVLRPVRPQLEVAAALVRELSSPIDAWRVCLERGLVPADWADPGFRAPGRLCRGCHGAQRVAGDDQGYFTGWFTCTWCHGDGVMSEAQRGTSAFDPEDGWTSALVAALAADPLGVLRVEALAREVAARVRPFRANDVRRFRWAVTRDGFDRLALHGVSLGWLPRDGFRVKAYAAPDAPGAAAAAAVVRGGANPTFPAIRRAARDVAAALAWGAAGPSPFEPLLEIWASGYVFGELTQDTVCLFAPAPVELTR